MHEAHTEFPICRQDRLKRQYQSLREGHLESLQLESWTNHDLYVWYRVKGRFGTNNDKNMVSKSPVFKDIVLFASHLNLDVSYRFILDCVGCSISTCQQHIYPN